MLTTLAAEIEIDRDLIQRSLDAIEEVFQRDELTQVELAATATFLHNIYSGMENIMKRILKHKDIPVPHTPTSHRDLLNTCISDGIISKTTAEAVEEYLAFRHFFIHGYGIKLDSEKLVPLTDNIAGAWEMFDIDIRNHLKFLEVNRENNND